MMTPSIRVTCKSQDLFGQSFMGIDGKVWVELAEYNKAYDKFCAE